jgi:uncharacterized protein YbjT (DUF2867 family)
MNKILVIGASGKIGRILFSKHLDAFSTAVAMVRSRRKQDFAAPVEVVEADLEQEIDFTMEECSTVVFTAGSGANTGLDKTLLVDLWGACKAIDAAKKHGVEHFIMVSSRGADNPDNGPMAIKPYLVAKHFADEYLIQSRLNYTILRPGRLTDSEATGLINITRPTDPEKQTISREDTAKVIVHCLNNKSVVNKIYELYKGLNTVESVII